MVSKIYRKYFRIIILIKILLIIILPSCHPSGKEVAGKYYKKHGKGIEYIELMKDGSFHQYFKNDTFENTNVGTWKFEFKHGQWKLEISDYIIYTAPFEREFTGKKGHASVYWEGEQINFYDDDDYNFFKKSDKDE